MILIGSRAIDHPDFPRKEGRDWDYVIDDEFIAKLSEYDTHASKEVYYALKPYCTMKSEGLVPSLEALYTLKVSHSFWNIHWLKTMRDIEWFQKQEVEFIPALHDTLYAYWETRHGKKKAYLNVDNEKFFTGSVRRKYVHDDIHYATCYYDEPMYRKLKKDLTKALISPRMFKELCHSDKLKLCREEAYVTALERFIIPNGTEPKEAYRRSMNLLVTSMSRGWFPKFIVLNWRELKNPDIDFKAKFEENLVNVRLV